MINLNKKDLNKLYKNKGESITINVKPNLNTLNFNSSDFLKNRDQLPSIIFVTDEQLINVNENKTKEKSFKLTLSKKQLTDTLTKTNKINKKIDSLYDEMLDIKDDYTILLNREYEKVLTNLMKYSSKTPMLLKKRQKILNVLKELLDQYKKVGEYYLQFVDLNVKQIYEILEKCVKGKTKGDLTLDFINKKKHGNTFPFGIYLTKRQRKYYIMWKKNKLNFEITLSNTQFHKTCFASIILNRNIYHYIRYGVLPPPPKIKRVDTPLAIEMKNLIDFDENITPTTNKTKPDLIPIIKTKPDLIPLKKNRKNNK